MKNKAQILYVEDDQTLSFVTRDNLKLHGFSVDYCEDGETALEKFKVNNYDLCILDVMLPKMDGFTLATKIRETNKQVPILFLTAKSTLEDKIRGLKLGGDDYIVKPFSIEELVLKIQIFLKRSSINYSAETPTGIVSIGKYRFDIDNQELCIEETKISLTYKQCCLLSHLFTHKNNLLKREEILQEVWGDDYYFSGRSLDVFISKLRKYFKQDTNISIENVHGIGFKFMVTES